MYEAVTLLESIKNNQLLVYSLIFFISFLESFAFVGEFVPGAVFSVGSGYLASKGVLNVYITIFSAVLGAILADVSSYILALKFYDKIKGKRFLKRYEDIINKGIDFFKKHGGKSIFLGRFVGALRPIVPFLAGVFRMEKGVFLFWAITSGILWGIAYVGVGYFFGNNYEYIQHVLSRFDLAILVILAIIVVVYFVKRRV